MYVTALCSVGRMRYDGLLANRTRHQHVAQCRQLLGTRSATRPDATPVPIDYRDRYHALTGRSVRLCTTCSRHASDDRIPIDGSRYGFVQPVLCLPSRR